MDHIFKFPQSPKERIDFGIAVAVCFIALGIVSWYSVKSSDQTLLADTEISVPNDIEIETEKTVEITRDPSSLEYQTKQPKPTFVNTSKAIVLAKDPEATVHNSGTTENQLGSFGIEDPTEEPSEIVNIEQEEPSVADVQEETEIQVETSTSEQIAQIEEEIKQLESQTIVEETIPTPPPVKELTTTIEPNLSQTGAYKSGNCRILVGAFSDPNNHKKVIRKLKSEGYKTFKTPFRGLTRVGIYNDCDSASLQSTLSTIREDFAKDAIILK